MYWQEQEDSEKRHGVLDDIIDVSFKVHCRQLPLDHAYSLSQAVQKALPWITDEPRAGIHLIHGAESGNGWIRPQEADAILHLSRRTRFMMRLPAQRMVDAGRLVDAPLRVGGYDLRLNNPRAKRLLPLKTLFSRYVITDDIEDETAFLKQADRLLKEEGIRVSRMMSGRPHVLCMPERDLYTRSLMIDGLGIEESIHLQQRGLGEGRKVGCGLFLPHKGIDAVAPAQEK